MKNSYVSRLAIFCAILIATAMSSGTASAAGEVNLYSERQPFLMAPLLDAFSKETGIKVNMVNTCAKRRNEFQLRACLFDKGAIKPVCYGWHQNMRTL